MTMNPQQQQEFVNKLSDALNKVIMSWDNDVKEWHPIALRGLDHASSYSLKIPQGQMVELFKTEKHGLNMNVISVLCRNMEERTPVQMGVSAEQWAEHLVLNEKIAKQWEVLAEPVKQKIMKEIEIMAGAPSNKILTAK